MFRISKLLNFSKRIAILSILMLFLLATYSLETVFAGCTDGNYPVGVYSPFYRICLPDGPIEWNGDLVVFAHGYIGPTEELAIVDYEISPENKPVSEIITGLGYAFATTSFSYNGLVIPQAVEDIRQLRLKFPDLSGKTPNNIYLVGASEGGQVTALALEKYPELFNGGLAICGPVGNFRKQINYFGDFLALFNYFFPDLLASYSGGVTPTPEEIPVDLVDQVKWNSTIAPAVLAAIQAKPSATRQLLQTANAPTDPYDPSSVGTTILGILWYGIFATNDAVEKLGGSPYDNSRHWYSGSRNDWLLNWRIDRFHADAKALYNIENGFQTSGRLSNPLVTAHTTQDPIVPYWHETIYNLKTLFGGSLLHHLNIPVVRYGHCAFSQEELLTAFAVMLFMAGGY
jgi:pimeloyl-ACP methyl ester carboxylesterase